jgi:SNF2 family DNA or RNA helicase
MGLGKTMTMLSAMAYSKLTTLIEIADNKDSVAEGSQLIRQTLVVLPSSRMYFPRKTKWYSPVEIS